MSLIHKLWPRPNSARTRSAKPFVLPERVQINMDALALLPEEAFNLLRQKLLLHDALLEIVFGEAGHFLLIENTTLVPESYTLELSLSQISIEASDQAGFYYAIVTLCQWLHLHRLAGKQDITCMEIEDEPHYCNRGVMLDISRNKVPTTESLYALIDLLASLKINQLQLYMEHSFAYEPHQVVWEHASPMTAQQIVQLDIYCAARFIDLVPNQNSFGHFHRWLVHEEYRALAECPQGVEHPFSKEKEPFSLCATDPGSLALLDGLYEELLANFTSNLFNVGLDETLDLGMGRSRQECEKKGKTAVYFEFLNKVGSLVGTYGRRMMYWADTLILNPELFDRMTNDGIALVWGYEAIHPFSEHAKALFDADIDFYVCPGTSSWNSFAGRLPNMMINLAVASKEGFKNGAAGYLITDWGDRGHFQPLPISYPAFMLGAALAWNIGQPITESELSEGLSQYIFEDTTGTISSCLLRLGHLYEFCGAHPENGSALFFLWWFIEENLESPRLKGLSKQGLEATKAELSEIKRDLQAPKTNPQLDQVADELVWVCDISAWCTALGLARLEAGPQTPLTAVPYEQRAQLAIELDHLTQQREGQWLLRNRPGGWQLSRQLMHRVSALLRQPN